MWRGEAVAPLSDHALSELHMPPQRQQARASDVEPRHDCRASLAAAPLSLPASLDSTQSDTDRAVAVLGEAMHRLNAGLFDSLSLFSSLSHERAPTLSVCSLFLCVSLSRSLLRARARAHTHTHTHTRHRAEPTGERAADPLNFCFHFVCVAGIVAPTAGRHWCYRLAGCVAGQRGQDPQGLCAC